MQIIIVQSEIERAITQYILGKFSVDPDQQVTIGLSATRGSDGFRATINITEKGDPVPTSGTKISRATKTAVRKAAASNPAPHNSAPAPVPAADPTAAALTAAVAPIRPQFARPKPGLPGTSIVTPGGVAPAAMVATPEPVIAAAPVAEQEAAIDVSDGKGEPGEEVAVEIEMAADTATIDGTAEDVAIADAAPGNAKSGDTTKEVATAAASSGPKAGATNKRSLFKDLTKPGAPK